MEESKNIKKLSSILIIILIILISSIYLHYSLSPNYSYTTIELYGEEFIISETTNFIIQHVYYDLQAANDIVCILEENYAKLKLQFNVEMQSKTVITLFPNLDMFHNNIDLPNVPNWVVGTAYNGDEIWMVSPNNPGPLHSYESIIKVSLHEFVHILSNKLNLNALPYLREGMSAYTANQYEGVKNSIVYALKMKTLPTLKELRSYSSRSYGIYQYGYAFVEYIVSEYGYEKLFDFYTNNDVDAVFNCSEEEFDARWMNYLKYTYVDN